LTHAHAAATIAEGTGDRKGCRMELYIVRHGHVDYRRAVDRYAVGLSPQGREQSERVAALCERWGIEFIVASTLVRAEQTADAIQARLPEAIRWDLDELGDVDIEERALNPLMSPRPSEWSADDKRLAYQRTWGRVTGALARLQVYARAHDLQRVALVTHESTANLVLLSFLGLDWRAAEATYVRLDWCSTSKLCIGDHTVEIDWVNRPS